MNAESIRKERAREAEMRKVSGPKEAAANNSSSSSPHMPRSGIVSGVSSESSSASGSRRTSRGRDSHSWEQGSAGGSGAFTDEYEADRVGRQRRYEAEEEREEEEEEDEPLHKYAKPVSRGAAQTTAFYRQPQQVQQAHYSQQRSSARPASPTPPSFAARPVNSSGASHTVTSLQQRVEELESQVAAMQSQQRLFLTFMETTQSQLAGMRGTAHTANTANTVNTADTANTQAAAAAIADSARTSSRPSKQQPNTQRAAQLTGTALRADDSRQRQYEYKDETADRTGRRTGLYNGQGQDEEEQKREEERERAAAAHNHHSNSAHSRGAPTVTQRKQSTRGSHDSSSTGTAAQSTRPVSRVERTSEEYYTTKATNTQPAAHPHQRTPARSHPPSSSVATSATASSVSPPSLYGTADESMESDPFPEQSTYPCPRCGRSFNESALDRHVAKALCQKAARKAFDVAAQRLQDVKAELSQVVRADRKGAAAAGGGSRKQQQQQQDEAGSAKQSKWRQERARLQEAIQAGKQITQALKEGKPLASIPVAVSSLPDDRVQCPHCLRRFAEHTAERHIPHCKNTASRMNAAGNATQKRK